MTIQYDSQGIITQNLTEIINEREANLQQFLGADFVIDKTTPIGNIELADANNELAIHELLAYLFPNQIDANTATGIFLDAICEKNRIYRKQPQYTKVKLTINGTPDTQLYSGDIIVQDNISNEYYDLNEDCIIGTDGKVLVEFICENYGDFNLYPSSKFEIQTPTSGVDSVTIDENTMDIVIGRFTETDEELRHRRQNSVGQTSTNTLTSIQSVIYSIDGVNSVVAFENDTEETKYDIPPKSFEIVVDGGDKTEITDAIFHNKPIGTQAYGTTTVQKTDSFNNLYTIGYTKAEKVNAGLKIEVKSKRIQSDAWNDQVKQAIKSKFEEVQKIGISVKNYNFIQVLTNFEEISDITSVDVFNVLTPESMVSTLEIGPKQIAKLNLENVTINVTVG